MTSAPASSPYPPFHPRRPNLPLALDPADFRREYPEEDQYVEFNRGVGQDNIQDTVVAFSNAEGGVILVGVEDNGMISGRRLDAGTADAIHQAIHHIRDPGRYSVHELSVDRQKVVVISVDRRHEGFAQTSAAVVKVRKGTRDEPLFGTELQHFISRRSAKRYELTLTDLPVDEADAARLAEVGAAFGWQPTEVVARLKEHGFAAETI